jgi:hypothetical protein
MPTVLLALLSVFLGHVPSKLALDEACLAAVGEDGAREKAKATQPMKLDFYTSGFL